MLVSKHSHNTITSKVTGGWALLEEYVKMGLVQPFLFLSFYFLFPVIV